MVPYTAERKFAGMGNTFARRIYVVAATKDGQTEFWTAATRRNSSARQLRHSLAMLAGTRCASSLMIRFIVFRRQARFPRRRYLYVPD